jgi:putative acyl-CoA dehydrogenase
MADTPQFQTHTVFNQSPVFADVNLFTSDRALQEAVQREGGGHATRSLKAFGAKCGSAEALEQGRLANEHPPRLRSFDPKGRRLDVVEYHPAYHWCMEASFKQGLGSLPYEHLLTADAAPVPAANVVRAAGSYMAAQMEAGHCCPVTMTHAAIAPLLQQSALARAWLPKLLTRGYDRSFQAPSAKSAVTIGMGMTEKQGGTDVRANTTRAEPLSAGGPGEAYRITGHKWFMSAPMSDAFLILAQAPGGLSCFLLPRFLPDGSVNPIRIQRLKDKLGNRSNASSEVEFEGCQAVLIGEEGRGVATIIEMVTATRLDCAVSSAGLMRLCLANALHHTRAREVFGKVLVEQPVMLPVLADLALEVEAATALVFRLARAFDQAASDGEAAWRRLMTPVTKYFVCKLGPGFAYEAMECLGGNGYVEDGLVARAFRELPVNAIWEGSGNVMCLDVLRVLMKEPEAAGLILDGLGKAISGERRLTAYIERVRDYLHKPRELEVNARGLVESLATAAAAALLRAHAPAAIADAYIGSRLEGGVKRTYGVGLGRADLKAIVTRAMPG